MYLCDRIVCYLLAESAADDGHNDPTFTAVCVSDVTIIVLICAVLLLLLLVMMKQRKRGDL